MSPHFWFPTWSEKKCEILGVMWDVGIYQIVNILEWEVGWTEVGYGTQTRILIFKTLPSVHGMANLHFLHQGICQEYWPLYREIKYITKLGLSRIILSVKNHEIITKNSL